MEKADYNVYVTRDYNQFKRLAGNRDVTDERITRIIKSIKSVGYIKNPIIVNEKMEIIDGQGRFNALKRLKLPIEYIITAGTGIVECREMNINMTNWTLVDYIKSYAEQGDENYIRFLDLLTNYGFDNVNIIATAIHRTSKAKNSEVKSGSFQVTEEQYEKAIKRLEYAKSVLDKLDIHKLPGSYVTLAQTIIYYADFPEINKDRLAYGVEKYIYRAVPWVLNEDCEKEVENAYNYNMKLKNKVLITHLLQEERMKRQLKLNEDSRIRALARVQKGIAGFITSKSNED